MTIIEVNKYYTAENNDYRGNPLVEVLPPLSKSHIRMLLTSTLPSTAEDRTHSADLRIQYVNRLFRFFIPFDEQVNFAYSMWSTICQAYTRWNPLKPSTQQAFNEMCESLLNGSYEPSDEISLFDSPQCITRFGTPGCGKTEVPKRLLRQLSKDGVFHHTRHGVYQRLFVWVEAPSLKTDKALSWVVYDALYELMSLTGTAWKRLPPTTSSSVLGTEAALLARKLNLGIIAIDELQHCIRQSIGFDPDAMSFLTSFINRVKTPVLLLGTWPAAMLSRQALRLGRRTVTPGSMDVKRLRPGKRWNAFIKALFTMQYTQQLADYSDELASTFYELTQGVPDIAIKLMALAQLEAIVTKAELIDKALLTACSDKHLAKIEPAILAMRGGALESDPTLWDAEPTDFEKYFAGLAAEYRLHLDTPMRRKHAAAASGPAKVDAVAAALTDLNVASPETAKAIAQQAVIEKPKQSPADITADVIAKARKKRGPTPTKNPKKQASTDAAFNALVDADIRKIVYMAGRAGTPVEAGLVAAGHTCDVTQLIPL